MTENKEVKGKKRSVSNLTIPHSKNQYTRAKKKKSGQGKNVLCQNNH